MPSTPKGASKSASSLSALSARARLAFDPGCRKTEHVPRQSGAKAIDAGMATQPRGDGLQHAVTLFPAERFIQVAEAVKVDGKDRETATGLRYGLAEAPRVRSPVRSSTRAISSSLVS